MTRCVHRSSKFHVVFVPFGGARFFPRASPQICILLVIVSCKYAPPPGPFFVLALVSLVLSCSPWMVFTTTIWRTSCWRGTTGNVRLKRDLRPHTALSSHTMRTSSHQMSSSSFLIVERCCFRFVSLSMVNYFFLLPDHVHNLFFADCLADRSHVKTIAAFRDLHLFFCRLDTWITDRYRRVTYAQ